MSVRGRQRRGSECGLWEPGIANCDRARNSSRRPCMKTERQEYRNDSDVTWSSEPVGGQSHIPHSDVIVRARVAAAEDGLDDWSRPRFIDFWLISFASRASSINRHRRHSTGRPPTNDARRTNPSHSAPARAVRRPAAKNLILPPRQVSVNFTPTAEDC